ncbi:hypothetical protein Q3G72_009007 [Acer saccharum]|nr:hypothetical protein Q3G72_009007 [Acer saccharum]
MNKLLMVENDCLQKQVSHLVYENGYMRTQLQSASATTIDNNCESMVMSGQHSQRDANNLAGVTILFPLAFRMWKGHFSSVTSPPFFLPENADASTWDLYSHGALCLIN